MRNSKKPEVDILKAILKYGILLVLVGWLSFAIVWANMKAQEEICTDVDVEILNADSIMFLNKKGILKELSDAHINPIGKPMSSINTEEIENALKKFDYLEGAECVIQNNSIITIEVTQLVPIMRVFTPHGSFYVNKDGKGIKADARYHIDVPVVIGSFDNRKNKITNVIPLVNYINADPKLSQYVTAIKYNDANNIYLIPNIAGHVVNFGNATNVESKFAKLEKFYREVIPVKGWWAYDTISVKWNYQIVASKRNFSQHQSEQVEDVDIDTDESAVDLSPIPRDNNTPAVTSPKQEEKVEKKVSEKATKKETTDKLKSKVATTAKDKEKKESSTTKKSVDKTVAKKEVKSKSTSKSSDKASTSTKKTTDKKKKN